MALSILCQKRILKKDLCKNLFKENQMPVFCGYSIIEKPDEWIRFFKLLKYNCNIQLSHKDFSKPCCGKDFSKPSCET